MRQVENIDLPEADRADGCPHPRETYDLIGHQAAEHKFLTARQSGRLHHAWLITGGPGIGKSTLAYRMIRSILGGQSRLETSLDIPETDPVAQRIESLGHGDFFLLRKPYDHKLKKLRTEIPVAETRKLPEFFSKRPAEGGWRVCLIDAIDDMNRNSENAILKTLEEPPDRAIMILISHRPGGLLPTIRSRCMTLALREVPTDQIASWLRGKLPDMDPSVLNVAAGLSRGAPGRAFALAQNTDMVIKPLTRFFDSLGSRDARIDQRIANDLSAQGREKVRALFWDALQDTLQQQAVSGHTGHWDSPVPQGQATKRSETWRQHWERVVHIQNREAALNMDKKTVMVDVLSAIRSA